MKRQCRHNTRKGKRCKRAETIVVEPGTSKKVLIGPTVQTASKQIVKCWQHHQMDQCFDFSLLAITKQYINDTYITMI